jgi:hypothetical protein
MGGSSTLGDPARWSQASTDIGDDPFDGEEANKQKRNLERRGGNAAMMSNGRGAEEGTGGGLAAGRLSAVSSGRDSGGSGGAVHVDSP